MGNNCLKYVFHNPPAHLTINPYVIGRQLISISVQIKLLVASVRSQMVGYRSSAQSIMLPRL